MGFTPSGDGVNITINAEDNASKDIQSVQKSLGGMRKAAITAGGVLAGIGIGGMAKATSDAADFEEAMVEVEKVTNAQTASEMTDEIMRMAEKIPLTQKELAGLAADAGRFGISGSENLSQFTESVAKIASATDLAAEDAGKNFAKIAGMTNTPISEIGNLGSAVNTLANNYKTSSSEIVDSMMRSSQAMSLTGMSQEEIAGLNAKMNELSPSARVAGTRLKNLFQEMQNPKKVGKMADALGMTEEQFKNMRDNDPKKLLQTMMTTMNDGGKAADGLKNALNKTAMTGLNALASEQEGVNEAMSASEKAYKENTSLQKEHEAATSTLNAKMELLKNKIGNVSITIGEQFIPVLLDLMDTVMPMIDAFVTLNEKTDGLAGVAVLATTVIGGLSIAAAALAPVIMGTLVPALGTAAGFLTGTLLPALGGIVAVLGGPLTIAILAIVALAGVLFYAWKNNFGGLRDTTEKVMDKVMVAFNTMKDVAEAVFEKYAIPLIQKLNDIWERNFADIAAEGKETLTFIAGIVSKYLEIVMAVWKKVGGEIMKFWDEWGDEITTIATAVFGFLELTIGSALDAIMTIVKVALALMRGDWESAFGYIEGFAERTWNKIVDYVTGDFLKGLKAGLTMVVAAIKKPFEEIYNWLIGNSLIPDMFDEIVAYIKEDFLDGLKDALGGIFTWYKEFWLGVKDWVVNTFADLLSKAFGDALTLDFGPFKDEVDGFIGLIDSALSKLDKLNDFNLNVDIPGTSSSSSSSNTNRNTRGTRSGRSKTYSPNKSMLDKAKNAVDSLTSSFGFANGGIVNGPVNAVIGEGSESEAVMPLSKLDAVMNREFRAGMEVANTGGGGASSVDVRLSVEGDDELSRLIKENAEVVVEDNEQRKRDRLRRR